jgi:uncharacterized protein (UPF0333 family)
MPNKDTSLKKQVNYDAIAGQLAVTVYKFFWIIIALAVLAVLYVAYIFFLLPEYNKIVSNAEVIKKNDEYLDKLQYYNQLIDLRNAYAKIKPEDKDKINQIVSNINDQNELYREVEYIVNKNGLKVESIEPVTLDSSYDLPNISSQTKQSPLLGNMKLTMTSCKMSDVNYESLLRVLKTFELNLRIMDIIKTEYDPNTRKAAVQFITYQF